MQSKFLPVLFATAYFVTHQCSVALDAYFIMVAGGYNGNASNGLLSHVELLCGGNSTCPINIPPLPHHPESATLGLIGQTTAQNEIILCGGKTFRDNQDKCYIYSALNNTWRMNIAPMASRRHLATAALDGNGRFWAIGGFSGETNVPGTEVFNADANMWTAGPPLPDELRNSGLSSHCSVRLNRSHVFIAGGYASHYSAPVLDTPGTFKCIGGRSLSKAWLFNGHKWDSLPDMASVRDRPACSLVPSQNGSLQVLVAGGCQGWCVKKPAVSSADIFDFKQGQWRPVADLPEPLSSAHLEVFEGRPTTFGGFNNVEENGVLYQYYVEENKWEAHPKLKLEVPRSSAAVFKVPKSLFGIK